MYLAFVPPFLEELQNSLEFPEFELTGGPLVQRRGWERGWAGVLATERPSRDQRAGICRPTPDLLGEERNWGGSH